MTRRRAAAGTAVAVAGCLLAVLPGASGLAPDSLTGPVSPERDAAAVLSSRVLDPGPLDDPRPQPAHAPVAAAPRLGGAYRFISSPDFLNQDVADLTAGRRAVTDPLTGEVANSTNAYYEAALDHVLGEMSSQGARDLLVAGDLVEGRWGRDDSRSGVFGPVRTDRQRLAAVRRAAGVYYPAWRNRVTSHGLEPFTAVGDHELGDDPWRSRRDPWIRFKNRHVQAFRKAYARHMMRWPNGSHRFADRPRAGQARDTAYAVRLSPQVLLVTIDVFTFSNGRMVTRVDQAQLEWLRGVLARARRTKVPWVIVQGHTPILGPLKSRNSSRLKYARADHSELWRTMVQGGVDVYLAGEMHDQSASWKQGVLQVVHGSLLYRGQASYVLGQATAQRLVLENHEFAGEIDFGRRLWTTSSEGAPGGVRYPDPSVVTGVIEARRTKGGGISLDRRTGVFAAPG